MTTLDHHHHTTTAESRRTVCWPGAGQCQPRRMPGSCALCRCHHGHCSFVMTRDNTLSGHQSQVGCKCLHTASSHCSLLLYPAISGEAPPRCVPSWSRPAWCEAAPDLTANSAPPSLSTLMSAFTGGRGRGWSTPELTSDCPLQLDTVRSLISQSSLRTLV